MPGANLPELTREITSISRDASEYPRRPMDSLGDTQLELKKARSKARTSNCNDVTFDTRKTLALKKLSTVPKYVYKLLHTNSLQIRMLPVH